MIIYIIKSEIYLPSLLIKLFLHLGMHKPGMYKVDQYSGTVVREVRSSRINVN